MKVKIAAIVVTLLAIVLAVVFSRPFDINPAYAISLFSQPFSVFILFFAIFFQFCGHYLRALKQKMILQQIRPLETVEVFKGQMIGSLFNTILPLRLGELFKAHYIGKGVSISRSAVFTTILFERLLDIFFLFLLGWIILLVGIGYPITLRNIMAFLAIGFVILAIVLYSVRSQKTWVLRFVFEFSRQFNTTIRDRIRMIAWSSIYGLKNTITQRILPKYLSLTVIMWIFYLLSLGIFVEFLFDTPLLNDNVRISISSYFGVSVPSGPAYLGSFQTIFTSLSGVSVQYLHDNNVTLLLWLLLVLPASILGLYFLLRPQRVYGADLKHDVDTVLKNKLYRDVDITKEFSHFLDAYFSGSAINRILTSEEVANNFQTIKTFKGGSNALTLLAWQNEKMVVKKITLKQYEDKLRDQYLWLKERAKLPQIARALKEHHKNPDYYAIDIEYRDNYIPFFDVIHSSSTQKSKEILRDVCEFVDKKIYIDKKPVKNSRRILDKYIDGKVIGKITDSANANVHIAHLLGYKTIEINDKEYLNFDAVLKKITSHKQAMADLTDVVECPIQGDLTVDNLIVNPADNKFIILDPNNENAISDPIVDYGKLMQSVHSGYEFLYSINSCSIQENAVNFEESRSAQYNSIYKDLDEYLKKKLTPGRYRAVLFHEAVHYCRMLTYRVSINPDTAAAFYCIAVRLFNEFIEQYDDAAKA